VRPEVKRESGFRKYRTSRFKLLRKVGLEEIFPK